MSDYRRSLATYRERFPAATGQQWKNALKSENYRRRAKGEREIVREDDTPRVRYLDKKVGTTDWREISEWVGQGQALRDKGGWSQRTARIEVENVDESILLVPFSDAHVGSWGASLSHLVSLTEEVISNPRIYLGCVGDLINLAIKLRGVLEVKDDILPPDMQHNFVESWLNEIAPKVLFAGWGNHDVEREEVGAGASIHKRMLERRVVYFNGIGHVDLRVGAQTYPVAVSHRFRGSTVGNPLNGHKQYMRREAQDRIIAIAGDLHTPAKEVYVDGNTRRLALNAGALHLNSGYGQRYFSLYTQPTYPCVELWASEHRFIDYWSIGDWLATVNRKPIGYFKDPNNWKAA